MAEMRSMRLVAHGQPLLASSMEVPRTTPRAVLVKVEMVGVCHTDLHVISGFYDLGDHNRID